MISIEDVQALVDLLTSTPGLIPHQDSVAALAASIVSGGVVPEEINSNMALLFSMYNYWVSVGSPP